MHSPRALVPPCGTNPPGLPSRKAGSTDLSPCAVSNYPREPDGCSLPLLPRRCQASSSRKAGADWPLPVYITRLVPSYLHGSGALILARERAFLSGPRSGLI